MYRILPSSFGSLDYGGIEKEMTQQYTLGDYDLKPGDWVKFKYGWRELKSLDGEHGIYTHESTEWFGYGEIISVLRPSVVIRDQLDTYFNCIENETTRQLGKYSPVNFYFEIIHPRKAKEGYCCKHKEPSMDCAFCSKWKAKEEKCTCHSHPGINCLYCAQNPKEKKSICPYCKGPYDYAYGRCEKCDAAYNPKKSLIYEWRETCPQANLFPDNRIISLACLVSDRLEELEKKLEDKGKNPLTKATEAMKRGDWECKQS